MKLKQDHKAVLNNTTAHLVTVTDVSKPYTNPKSKVTYPSYPYSVIKNTNKKLGPVIKKGHLKGQTIYTLTLEERATCTDECEHYRTCFGNNMPYSHRFTVNESFMIKLEKDVKELAILPKNKDGFMLRLHVLGDFMSVEYVLFWKRMLQEIPNLNIYGYTRNHTTSKYAKHRRIAFEIVKLSALMKDRFAIRFSNKLDEPYSAISAEISTDGIACPAQTKKGTTCADCALCWNRNTNKPIIFTTH